MLNIANKILQSVLVVYDTSVMKQVAEYPNCSQS